MLEAIIKAVISALLGFFGQRVDQAKQRRDDHVAGARDAAIETDQTTKDIADARAKAAANPDDDDAIADRLQRKATARGGGPGPAGSKPPG